MAAMLFVAIALVLVLALTALELAWPARREADQRGLNLLVWALRTVPALSIVPLISPAVVAAGRRVGFEGLDVGRWPPLLGGVVFFLAMDFGEYAFHRAQHTIPFLWRMHSVHHSDPCVNATTTERHWWGDVFLKSATIWPAAILIAGPAGWMSTAWVLASLYNYFTHANLPVNLGRLSWVINSPAYHRLHHSRDAADHGANYAALFPIYDVLFGTYRRPTSYAATGLDRPAPGLGYALWPREG